MKTLHPILIAAALLAVACDEEKPERIYHEHPKPDPEPSTTRTVKGLEEARYVLLDGTLLEKEPIDFHDTLFEAHVPKGDGYEILPGFGRRDGTFEIPGVPQGDYWLRIARRPFGDDYLWTDSSDIDYSADSLGPREAPSGDEGTAVSFIADGLDAWQEGDSINFYGPNHVIFAQDLNMNPLEVEGVPEVGATALEGMKVKWVGRHLANLEVDEDNVVVQFRTSENEQGVAYRAPVRSYTPAPIQHASGTVAEITGTFAEPPVIDYRLAWNLAAFEELRGAIHPTAARASQQRGLSLHASALAGEERLGWSPDYPLFQLQDPSVLEANENLDLGSFAIPNPYPAEWVVGAYTVHFPVHLPFPGAGTEDFPLEAIVGRRTRQIPTTDAPIVPTLTPVIEPRLDGQDTDDGLADISRTPVLSFEKPALGEPNAYLVQVIEALPTPPEPFRPGWYLMANLWLPGDVTEIRLPEDVLRPGSSYTLLIRAIEEPGKDLRSRPGLMGVESALADRYTGVFTVAAE